MIGNPQPYVMHLTKPNVKWDDIVGLESAKDVLQAEIVLPARLPHLVDGKEISWNPILLYGPHRESQWRLAEAAATEAGMKLLSVDGSILCKSNLFETADFDNPVVIFIDNPTPYRGPGQPSYSSGFNESSLLYRIGAKLPGTPIIVATSHPWDYWPAVLKRFQNKLHIPWPDTNARMKMIQETVGSTPSAMQQCDYRQLAHETEKLADNAIRSAIREAFKKPLSRIIRATHYKPVSVDGVIKFTPCSPEDSGAIEMSWQHVKGTKLREPPLLLEDCLGAIKDIPDEISLEMFQKYDDWTTENGQNGA